MDDPALRLAKALHMIDAQKREQFRLEQQVRRLTSELTRARRIIVGLQRQAQAREKETTDAGA